VVPPAGVRREQGRDQRPGRWQPRCGDLGGEITIPLGLLPGGAGPLSGTPWRFAAWTFVHGLVGWTLLLPADAGRLGDEVQSLAMATHPELGRKQPFTPALVTSPMRQSSPWARSRWSWLRRRSSPQPGRATRSSRRATRLPSTAPRPNRAAAGRGRAGASPQSCPGETGRAARPRGEPESAMSHDGARLRLRADGTARRREAGMGVFVAGGSRSQQSAAWAGVGRAWELPGRGGGSAGPLPRSRGANRGVSLLVAGHER
jgi:hypothetical protein